MKLSTAENAATEQADRTALYDQIEAEFEAIKQRYRAKLGPEDVAYIKGLRLKSRIAEVIGRGLLWISKDPLTFALGVAFTWLHRNLESIEIGHNVLHGQYDSFPEIPQFHSRNFKWKAPVDEEGWRREHNGLHHVHTNVFEKDPDLNHGILRMNDQVPWNNYHRWQVPMYLFIAYPIVLYGFNQQNLGFRQSYRERHFPTGNVGYAPVHHPEDVTVKDLKRRHWLSVGRVLFKEYLLFPTLALLTGFSYWKVFLGNMLVDGLNNYWVSLTIQATHFTAPLQPEDALRHKGHWYLTQLDSSVNFKGGRAMSILWGHLNYQIEHHLFPDVPSRHYPDMALEVQEVCKKHGLNYQCNPSWGRAIRNYLGVMWKYSFPPKAAQTPTGEARHA
ncbi:MAG TPA: acyl-CoA desaturase [Aquabacterium sp.]|uniref:fatty acid desaturase family protein n=1 Tax=Aquabacterium sp. TaxID=1872578 RepID=UPI002E364086|nr:acyl-CoA desaturase [Aquabacterium sp.]HEX5372592.1 acyl-CoA desaturase [Aquabacterium sp.]